MYHVTPSGLFCNGSQQSFICCFNFYNLQLITCIRSRPTVNGDLTGSAEIKMITVLSVNHQRPSSIIASLNFPVKSIRIHKRGIPALFAHELVSTNIVKIETIVTNGTFNGHKPVIHIVCVKSGTDTFRI